jgi:integrase
VPPLGDFAPRFLAWAESERHKASGIAAKETSLRVHLIPLLGTRRLDAITNLDIQELKHKLKGRSAKTCNNTLTCLNTLLKRAVEWGVLETMPCTIKLLKLSESTRSFYDFEEFERLVSEAMHDWRAYLIVLLGGEAGLRLGEMLALEWSDIDFQLGHVVIARSEWKGTVGATKGGRSRPVELTRRLSAALRKHQHLRNRRVLVQSDGASMSMKTIQQAVERAARRAKVKPGVHILRHTFCSHLAMKGAVPRQIQELAGHKDLSTTMRYMHLSPLSRRQAIQLLDAPVPGKHTGNGLEQVGNMQIP